MGTRINYKLYASPRVQRDAPAATLYSNSHSQNAISLLESAMVQNQEDNVYLKDVLDNLLGFEEFSGGQSKPVFSLDSRPDDNEFVMVIEPTFVNGVQSFVAYKEIEGFIPVTVLDDGETWMQGFDRSRTKFISEEDFLTASHDGDNPHNYRECPEYKGQSRPVAVTLLLNGEDWMQGKDKASTLFLSEEDFTELCDTIGATPHDFDGVLPDNEEDLSCDQGPSV